MKPNISTNKDKKKKHAKINQERCIKDDSVAKTVLMVDVKDL